jgi:hypothetical protein
MIGLVVVLVVLVVLVVVVVVVVIAVVVSMTAALAIGTRLRVIIFPLSNLAVCHLIYICNTKYVCTRVQSIVNLITLRTKNTNNQRFYVHYNTLKHPTRTESL